MRISGFSFIRNGIKFDYPFRESILSILPLCDEFVIAVGKSEDETLEQVRSIGSDKIKIIETVWDESLREGGRILAQQTNIALDAVKGDWAFYLQGDEVVHEKDLAHIQKACDRYSGSTNIEGLLFSYKHFYGSYNYIGNSRRWYRREVRIVRNSPGVRSWGDAQGFRINGRKLKVKLIDAEIYHYGWVKSPVFQQAKQKTFNKLWHNDEWMNKNIGNVQQYDYSKGGRLIPFNGTHPQIMLPRVRSQDWSFEYNPSYLRESVKDKLLNSIETTTGFRIGEYKNYTLM